MLFPGLWRVIGKRKRIWTRERRGGSLYRCRSSEIRGSGKKMEVSGGKRGGGLTTEMSFVCFCLNQLLVEDFFFLRERMGREREKH